MLVSSIWRAHGIDRALVNDYSHLSGYGVQGQRIDPHTHIQPEQLTTDMLKVAELIRSRHTASDSNEKSASNDGRNQRLKQQVNE